MKKILIIILFFRCSLVLGQIQYNVYMDSLGYERLSTTKTPKSALTGSYNDLTNKPTIPSTLTAGSNISIVANAINNTAPDQTVTLTAGNGIAITGTYPNFTIAVVQPTINNSPGRSLNSNFTISTTKAAIAVYSVTAQVTNPLLAGTSAGTINLEYSTNAGSTWQGALQVGNSSNVGITVTVQLTNAQTTQVIGIIPANALVRLRTTTSGTSTITYVGGQEIVY